MRLGLAFIIYVLAGFLTFGHVYNVTQNSCWTGDSGKEICWDNRGPAGVASGILWPIYWLGRISIDLTAKTSE